MASRILLADDSITIQKVVNLTFADEGIEVVAVSNGDVAERRLNEVKPDLVLADIFMPGKNGYELCEAIKQNSQFRNVPVVLLVGAFEPFDQVEARRVRADAHLTKPFESRTLVETVRRLISATGRTTGPIAQMPSPGEHREERIEADAMPPRVTTPTGPKLDLSEMMVDPDPAPATTATGNTGELASSQPGAQVFDIGVMDLPAQAQPPVRASLTDASDQFESLEMPPIGDFAHNNLQSPSGQHDSDMILDFDRVDPLESKAPLGSVSFETEAVAHLEVDLTGSGNGAGLFTPYSLDTRAVDIPSTNDGWNAGPTTPSLSGEPPAFRPHDESAFAHSEASNETACATMLASDEPLGDLLLDETVSAGLMSFSQDSLDIELTDPAKIEASSPGTAQFDLVETEQASSHEFEAIEAVQNKPRDLEVHANEAAATVAPEPGVDPADLPADSHRASTESNDILDWTSPNAHSYSTAQLDSVMMPIDTAEYLKENPSDNGAQPADNTEEASFERAQMWPEEEARFTAIDIEAFPVMDVEEPKSSADHLGPAETGFSFSPVTPEHAGPVVEDASGNAAPSESTTFDAEAQSELSSAAIDEIVRRVVAEMSESVVREVAWEVVPDCVERVIDQLTRESLSRRV